MLPIVIITSAEAHPGGAAALREAGYGVGRHPLGGRAHPRAALRRPRHPHRHGARLARALGEAAPLLLVGAVTGAPAATGALFGDQLQGPVHRAAHRIIADWARQPGSGFDEITAAAIVVLLVVVLAA